MSKAGKVMLLCLAGSIGVRAQQTNAPGGGAAAAAAPAAPAPASGNPVVVMDTSMGMIKAELWPDKAPATVSNFLAYADARFFDGLIFHRVIPGFMIQGGGFTPEMQQKQGLAPIRNEAREDTPNSRGTLAMARTSAPDSATSQFFINLVDNRGLDKPSPDGFGYCVFGKVTEGLDVVDKIAKVQTGSRGMHRDVPVEPVIIKAIRRAP
jgi:peptidyl-prolyl cis-trans isomerase A (cyclophilin A)